MFATATIAVLLAFVLVLSHTRAAHAAAQTKPQQSCINAINKGQAKLAAAQGKANAACVKSAGKGKLPPGQTAQGCVSADSRGKIDKAAAKVASADDKKCKDAPEQLPDFGYAYDPASGFQADPGNSRTSTHHVGRTPAPVLHATGSLAWCSP